MIRLEKVSSVNFRQCINLKVAKDQEQFIAPNMYTIAEAYVEEHLIPYAIMVEEEVVGLLATENIPDEMEEDRFWIPRFMIGEKYQRKGYGKEAMQEIIQNLTKDPTCYRIRLSVVPDNKQAMNFYKNIGFISTGIIAHGEEIMEYIVK
ncbi:GNAT family N-acetyltransferase [Sutcliffiella cohnii]|uniref:GNAT family N-acetyltransferase n=1 Tax=Sutcliffiella cohnii TaxID=33932 RepID=UPI002E1FAC09|nr:GNAT family N-acetyltransferase [Sutcliffiella cohnii]